MRTMRQLDIRRDSRRTHGRRGSLMVDAGAAVMMLTVAMTLTVKVVGWAAREHREIDRRQQALREIANLMERIGAIPYRELTPETIKPLSLSPNVKSTLPDARHELEVVENDPVGGENSKKVSVRIRWRNRAGDWDSPVSLTSWVYRSTSK